MGPKNVCGKCQTSCNKLELGLCAGCKKDLDDWEKKGPRKLGATMQEARRRPRRDDGLET